MLEMFKIIIDQLIYNKVINILVILYVTFKFKKNYLLLHAFNFILNDKKNLLIDHIYDEGQFLLLKLEDE